MNWEYLRIKSSDLIHFIIIKEGVMKKLLSILTLCVCWYAHNFAQGSWSQTTTAEFNTNTNFNVNIGNDEMKLTNDVGNGLDGDLYVPPGGTVKTDNMKTFVTGNNPSGQTAIQVSSSSGFQIGEEVLIITMQDNNPDLNNNIAGQYEFKRISNKTATALVFQDNLANTYNSSGKKHQVLKVHNFNNVTIDVGGILTCDDWDGTTGGVLVFRATGLVKILALGKVDASQKGLMGGQSVEGFPNYQDGYQGESYIGVGQQGYTSNNFNGGGGGEYGGILTIYFTAGGGGGHATIGGTAPNNGGYQGGVGGSVIGTQFLTRLYFGGAGGSGSAGGPTGISGKGGNGGGIVYISCDSISPLVGNISADGENGGSGSASSGSVGLGGGGGAGGSIFLISHSGVNMGNNFCSASGGVGTGTYPGGNGGTGRIRIDAPSITGTTIPPVGYEGTSYAYVGTSTTPLITKPVDQFWGILNFNVNTGSPGTKITVGVLNSDGSVLLDSVPTGSNLNYLGLQQSINSIKLIARLYNSLGNQTPILFDWTVEWTVTDIKDVPLSLLNEFVLEQNYPNPFNPATSIEYQIPELSFTTIKICDVLGKEIETLVNEEKPAGTYEVMWNAADLPSGVYFYRMQAGSYVNTKKMMVIK